MKKLQSIIHIIVCKAHHYDFVLITLIAIAFTIAAITTCWVSYSKWSNFLIETIIVNMKTWFQDNTTINYLQIHNN